VKVCITISKFLIVCVKFVCVEKCETNKADRDRQRQAETDRDRQRQKETDKDRKRQTETDRLTERHTGRDRQTSKM
jgi:hypothetical protein